MNARRRGITLLELIVVLALLGLSASVVGLGFRQPPAPAGSSAAVGSVARLRHAALETGRVVTDTVGVDGQALVVTALPDGRVVAPSSLLLDPFTGRARDAH